jgi:ubiquinone/menaquinone biosynthesis C-methylase UbiE
LKRGERVCDLGCGAGVDVFLASRAVGESGRVIGVDMTAEMLDRARAKQAALALANVEFRLGELRALPVESGSINCVISNCVINLCEDKRVALAEAYRVLTPGGRLCVADVVNRGVALPDTLRTNEALAC